MTGTAVPLHIYFLLDRSGAMHQIASDVIGGFNGFLAAQQAEGKDAVMTLVQFDSQDPHEVLTDSTPLSAVRPLTSQTFQPRGGTPLYDAMGHTIADATIRAERLLASNQPAEEIQFVTFTDGMENQSVEYTRDKILQLIAKREADGWAFAYLGSNHDSYAEGGKIGHSPGSIQNYAPDAAGSAAAFSSLSGAMSRRRQKMRTGESYDKKNLFENDKTAEDDLRKRQPSS
jgi:hypothetical protein